MEWDRKLGTYRKEFISTAVADVFRALSGSSDKKSKMGAIILSLALIDYLLPVGANRDKYIDWVNKKMKPLYSEYEGEVLYNIRCQYIHNYGEHEKEEKAESIHFMDQWDDIDIEGRKECAHMRRKEDGTLMITSPRLVADIVYAVMMDLQNSNEEHFKNKLRVAMSIAPIQIYRQMHPALGEFDKNVPNRERFIGAVEMLFMY